MKQISTPATTNTDSSISEDKEQFPQGIPVKEASYIPSERKIRNILAYSRSFEVLKSELLGNIGLIKN